MKRIRAVFQKYNIKDSCVMTASDQISPYHVYTSRYVSMNASLSNHRGYNHHDYHDGNAHHDDSHDGDDHDIDHDDKYDHGHDHDNNDNAVDKRIMIFMLVTMATMIIMTMVVMVIMITMTLYLIV